MPELEKDVEQVAITFPEEAAKSYREQERIRLLSNALGPLTADVEPWDGFGAWRAAGYPEKQAPAVKLSVEQFHTWESEWHHPTHDKIMAVVAPYRSAVGAAQASLGEVSMTSDIEDAQEACRKSTLYDSEIDLDSIKDRVVE